MVDGEAYYVTEMSLHIHFHHSVAGSWVGGVNADPCLRARCVGKLCSRPGSVKTKKKLLRPQVHPLDVWRRLGSSDCPGVEMRTNEKLER